MNCRITRLLGTLVVATALGSSTLTAQVLDQSNSFPPAPSVVHSAYVNNVWSEAQTFRVGLSGEMARLDVEVLRQGQTSLPLFVELRRTSGGIPVDPASLATVELDAEHVPLKNFTFPYVGPFTSVDLSAFHIPVTVGDQLAIVLRSDEPYESFTRGYLWRRSDQFANPYANGAACTKEGSWRVAFDNADFAFKTYVNIPEPSVPLLALSGLALRHAIRRRVKA